VILLRLAWRNVLRNRRRTLLAGLAIGIGLAGIIFTDGLLVGMKRTMIRSATSTFLGHAQIHSEGFRTTLEVERTIANADRILADLNADSRVAGFAPRTQAFAMITSPANVGAISLFGVDPRRETSISRVHEAIVEGSYLDAGERGRILIGSGLARSLEVAIDDRIVVTAAQAGTGELAQGMFRVAGIFHFNMRALDDNAAFIPLDESQSLLGLGSGIHEIALRFDDIIRAGDRRLPFWERYGAGGNEALGWRDLLPELDAALALSDFTMYAVFIILFAVVGLSIMNTLFMSLYERLFEFGVLRAVGTRPSWLAAVVLLEAACLAGVSIVIGSAIGAALMLWFGHQGIDYVGIEYAGVTFVELLYPVFEMRQFLVFPLWVVGFALVAGIYPALFAARLVPADAMRRSL
jgi:ABC-type lipoprotein release transport system permease subunit